MLLDNSKQFAVTYFYMQKKNNKKEIYSCYFLHIFHGARKKAKYIYKKQDINISQRVDNSINSQDNQV